MLPIHVILHPTDFAENSKPAFQLACALARDYGAKLVIMHVYATPVWPIPDGGVVPMSMEEPRAQLLEELDEIEPRDPSIVVERSLVEGEPAFEILRAAGVYEADLIIMGTHGRGGLRRFLMGSVAEEVSRKATCPVLTVRTNAGISAEKSAATEHAEPVEVC
jgi:nucleotide-binding universal stress UspA family protein